MHAHGTVLYDPRDGLYKAWYVSTPATGLDAGSSAETGRALAYAISKDGQVWNRPQLELVQWRGQKTNLLLQLPGGAFVQYVSVFVDANLSSARPYEMFVLCQVQPPGFKGTCPRRCLYRRLPFSHPG